MPQVNTLFRAAANGSGTVLDTGAAGASDKINYQLIMPKTVTAYVIVLATSPDNTTYTNALQYTNVIQASGEFHMPAGHRFYKATVSGYTGSGTIVMTAELGNWASKA
jgi:hypothetical protein